MNDYMRENKIETVAPQQGAGAEAAGKAGRSEHAETAPPGGAAKPAVHGS